MTFYELVIKWRNEASNIRSEHPFSSSGVYFLKADVLDRCADELDNVLAKGTEVECNHGVTFDEDAARGLSAEEVRKRWPRLAAGCPFGCGFRGIYYASYAHYLCGDW